MPVKILKEIDVSEYVWCNSAVMFRVQNGKGVITHQHGKGDEDYYHYSKLLLNGKPILQGHLPACPTCNGLLATGYGIENTDCPELKAVRECLNSNYTDIRTSAEMLKPLLNLLDDGYYLLADVPHDPTDGNNNFFWSVPNNLTENPASCDEYYNSEFYSYIEGFPKYLYPTQSANCCSQKRIDEYVEILKNNPSPPRALAYHEYGFISALLDGHHKATASALLGQAVNCLTIISVSSFTLEKPVKSVTSDTRLKSVGFSNIQVSVPVGSFCSDYFQTPRKTSDDDLTITEYNLTGRKFPQAEINAKIYYCNIKEFTDFYSVDIQDTDFTDDIIDKWINNNSSYENRLRLKYAFKYLTHHNIDMAYRTAVKSIKNNILCDMYEIWEFLKNFKDEQTEQLFIDHIVEYGNKSTYYDIVTSYWD
ncbi:MAG: hypothetical protein K2J08_05775 [Ruminococcus sp.]|nr:hypothetical protein [Ruminococcus sp.]